MLVSNQHESQKSQKKNSSKTTSSAVTSATSFASSASVTPSYATAAKKSNATKIVEKSTKIIKSSKTTTSQIKITYASKAAENVSEIEQNWTTVARSKKTATESNSKTQKSTVRDRRLLISAANQTEKFDSLACRNQINDALKKADIKDLLVVKATLSVSQSNVIIETAKDNTADQLLQNKQV
ncbi:MAG: hypothetical protein M1836_000217 [Candelina mexicana]|nr:MAG: hypothetical protein M1836_000217 [Candelina mexicana]